jgi:hypothetical protein
MTHFVDHPVVQSVLGRLQETFGEKGKTEELVKFPATVRIVPEVMCQGFRRMGWTAEFEKTEHELIFRFSQPPPNSLPILAKHTSEISQLVPRVKRFITEQIEKTQGVVTYPLRGVVSYRVAEVTATLLRSSGVEITMISDPTSRLTGFLITLPSDPSRALNPKLTE